MHGLILLGALLSVGEKPEAAGNTDVANSKPLSQLVKEIRDKDPGVAWSAMDAIPAYGAEARKEAGRALIARLNDSDVSLRATAAYTISLIGLETRDVRDAVKALTWLMRDPEAIVRYRAAAALARLGPDAHTAVFALSSALSDRTWEVRKAVAFALGTTGGDGKNPPEPRAVQALTVHGLKDWCAQVKIESLHSLIRLGPPENPADQQAVMRTLDGLLKDRNRGVVLWARLGLMRMARQPDVQQTAAIARALRDPDAATRMEAARVLGAMQMEGRAHVGDLVAALRDKEIFVVRAAAAALAEMKDAVTAKDLRDIAAMIGDEDIQVRCNACLGLAALGEAARTRVPDLIEALKDKQPEVVTVAAQALQEVGDGRAVAPLNQALAVQREVSVRLAIVQALDRITKREQKDVP